MSLFVRKKKLWITLSVILAILLLLTGVCAAYLGDYYRADTGALAAFAPQNAVICEISDDGTVTVQPAEGEIKAGFIFYPGGKVEHTAYIPLMKALASEGVLCVLVEMPFRLAVFDMNAADGIPARFPDVKTWYIGGHSLGGSMAACYLETHAEDYAGLVLLGSYSSVDLADSALSVLSAYGSEDGVLHRDAYEKNRKNLPADLTEVIIEGGNHAGFGMYGHQDGDGVATITPAEQIDRTVAAILSVMEVQDRED